METASTTITARDMNRLYAAHRNVRSTDVLPVKDPPCARLLEKPRYAAPKVLALLRVGWMVEFMLMTAERMQDELELVARIKSGDRGAFKRLVDQLSRRIINDCHRITGNRMDAEDVAQEVFIEVYRNIGGFRGESSLATWIMRIARNRALNYVRDNRDRMKVSLDTVEGGGGGSLGETLPGKRSDQPDRNLEIRRNRAILYSAIAELPDKYRKPFTLHKLEGMPYSEIAETLDISLSAVESRIHRAKLMLQKNLSGILTAGKKIES